MRIAMERFLVIAGLSTALMTSPLVSPSAQAQSGGWKARSDEYKCLGVDGASGTLRVSVYRDHPFANGAPFMISVRSSNALPAWAGSGGIGIKVQPRSSGNPSIRYNVSTERKGQRIIQGFPVDLEFPVITLYGGYDLLEWLSRSSRSFDYAYQGRVVETFTLADFSGARAALDNCRPIAPPPNRPLTPQGNMAGWLDVDAIDRALTVKRSSIGPFSADLLVNYFGRVERCTVTLSTGLPNIDQLMCNQLKKNGRYRAATDALGKHIAKIHNIKFGAIQF
ncbi:MULTISPECIES: hypothetical protein [unclassified Sphingomonas]|uniref:hypothetical protein n=1 Tax=unclassified Sphingomonas TaxID=196159 RepID=UPI0021509218|nr:MULTISPECIES: hypothetical protein [unclassified Sphingomonas]MCR5869869.1 hypothetical protein [Sphingomonas sp. J344]UUX98431.1 hypothetical protein LRS08_12750 [Sphingomonas sp. J315]